MTTAALPAGTIAEEPDRLGFGGYVTCLLGIVWREVMRFLHQRERFFSALVRPLIWLFIFAAGFRQVLGVSIIPPYSTYVLYETFVMPGLVGMILLFNAMQSSLSMVYDRETGAMRTLLVSPFPRSFLLLSKLLGGVFVALLQAYTFLVIARLWEAWTWSSQDSILTNIAATWQQFGVVDPHLSGYLTVLPALILSGLMLGSLALFMSSVIKQLENFAGVMNFVIFPMFFASSALYPLWRIKESSVLLYEICRLNPFTHAVELIRFGLYGQIGPPVEQAAQAAADGWSFAVVNGIDLTHLYVVVGCTLFFLGAAVYAYNPSKGLIGRRGGAGAGA
ncbi:MAG: ABC transporter permease [Hyphomicrobiaceae bacterium]|jgi:ABC-2 type transport system permease protein|nr:ABC transporter permease [Hyphomicrobiaceae bacterium]